MRAFTIRVFDETITGTAATWYTSASHNDQLGSADTLFLHAVTTDESGNSPVLYCQVEHSADARKWMVLNSTAPEIDGVAIVNDKSYTAVAGAAEDELGFVRIKIWLGGTNPSCRVKLFVTGRTRTARGARKALASQM